MTAPAATSAAGVPAGTIETAAAVGAAGLALTSTGSMVVAAVLLGVAARSRWTGVASLLAVAAVGVRFSTVTFDDLAGLQSVLGSAGTIGATTAAASAWVAAGAVIVGVRTPTGATGLHCILLALAAGGLATAIAVGPGPGGELALRVGATVLATVFVFVSTTVVRGGRAGTARTIVSVVAGVAAIVLAGWPS